ncbi:Hint domain-containing protein [Pukyongiella litopenaei]|uniref:Hint domain-containing protein n=1 Tax=Pukyongiella litopenaei TaxID=2605946 RepID=A0A2S0MQ92_9RHOB|nr:Hint domain-containing protein [Pukyongiella litopenaei]AVO38016.1 Hint domain-containing protein [Pukyongiella litopenaei]
MPTGTDFSVIYLGQLPIIDPIERNSHAEDAQKLVGKTFDSFTKSDGQTLRPSSTRPTYDSHRDSGGHWDTYNQDDAFGIEYFEIVHADGTVTTHHFDAIVGYHARITYLDDTTGQPVTENVVIEVAQDADGNTWVVPPSAYTPDAAALDNRITSITITGVKTSGSSGMAAEREQIPDIEPVPCFASGTRIETERGAVAIENLSAGDLVMTRDNGLQPVRWIGMRALSADILAGHDNLRPIRIRRHALGVNIPSTDLLVSPQHRILVRSAIAQRMFGTDEVLVAAKQLCQIDGIDIAEDVARVIYFHMLFDRHEVVIANGAETESLYTGPEALKSVGRQAATEIFTLFPELKERDHTPLAARTLATGCMARKLAGRHMQNGKALVS